MLFPMPVAGDCLAGERNPLSGHITNLRVRTLNYGSAEAAYDARVENPDSHQVVVLLDGAMVARNNALATSAGLAGIGSGEHSIDVRMIEAGEAPPNWHGDEQGQRAWLEWDRSTDAACKGYRIYWDEGNSGGAVDELLASVSQVTIQERINMKGGHSGRINVYGGYTGTQIINDVVTLTLADTGEWETTCALGTAEGTFELGHSLALPYGIWVEILDDLMDYDTLSTYEITVGPGAQYLTDKLDPGDYRFKVVAVNAAGDESDASDIRTVRIYPVPPEVPAQFIEWDPVDEEMRVGWDPVLAAGMGIVDVKVYTNFSDYAAGLTDDIIEDMPYRTVEAVDGGLTLARADVGDGLIRLYLRAVDADGEERKSVRLVEFTMPPVPIDLGLHLGIPTDLQAVGGPAATVLTEWNYTFYDGTEGTDALTGFEVVAANSSGGQTFTGVANVSDDDGDDGFPEARYEKTLTVAGEGTWYVKVRAMAAGGNYRESAEVAVVVDNTPPEFGDELRGVSQ